MMRERIYQCAERLASAAVIAAAITACSATPQSSTAALGRSTTTSQASTTACSTQGGGGDNLPAPCAPTTSQSGPPGVTSPPTESVGRKVTCAEPSVTGVSPGTGSEAGGDLVTITGTGFGIGLDVFFGGSRAQSITIDSGGELIATSPPRVRGIAAITVSCAGTDFQAESGRRVHLSGDCRVAGRAGLRTRFRHANTLGVRDDRAILLGQAIVISSPEHRGAGRGEHVADRGDPYLYGVVIR